jgi:2-methylcitrate dehydratase PrpD
MTLRQLGKKRMDELRPTRALAAFAAGLDPRHLPGEVREKLGWLLLDYLRVASIGARLPWSEWARGYVEAVALAGASRVLFSPDALNPEHATFMNVTFGSSFDGDDTHVGRCCIRRSRPGGGARGRRACLVSGRRCCGGGRGLRLLSGSPRRQPSHFEARGSEHRHCDGFGTAAAAGRLCSATGAGAASRDNCHPSGNAQFYYSGSAAERIQAAHAAQSGVAAALLAQHGFAGPPDILEGAGGFARAYADGWNPALIEDGLGTRFHLMDVLVKSHAAAARVAAGIDGMLALRRQHRFAAADIASMHLGIPRIIQGRLTNKHPADLQAAQMCLPFSVALAAKVALTPGRTLGVADYEAGLGDRSLYDLEERTTLDLDDEVEAASNVLSTAARVSVQLRDGRSLSVLVRAPKGSASDPFTGAEHEARFTQELSRRVSEGVCRDRAHVEGPDRLDPRWLGRVLGEDPAAGAGRTRYNKPYMGHGAVRCATLNWVSAATSPLSWPDIRLPLKRGGGGPRPASIWCRGAHDTRSG